MSHRPRSATKIPRAFKTVKKSYTCFRISAPTSHGREVYVEKITDQI